MFVVAIASSFNGFLVGMAIGGLGFGAYMANDLALVADVLDALQAALWDAANGGRRCRAPRSVEAGT